jgi:hypothetical protein
MVKVQKVTELRAFTVQERQEDSRTSSTGCRTRRIGCRTRRIGCRTRRIGYRVKRIG